MYVSGTFSNQFQLCLLYTSYLSSQSDIQVLRVKDYIKNPKQNGYRSLHVIYAVPVFLSSGAHYTPVEVQFRTIAMDYWASLEHALRYKTDLPDNKLAEHSQTPVSYTHLDGYKRQLRGPSSLRTARPRHAIRAGP